MRTLARYEQDYGMIFPEAYIDFFYVCQWDIHKDLVGTHLINHYPEMKEWAIELLEENGLTDLLDEKDFVFMMHQGYMFWYFKADGNQNPDVYGYYETHSAPKHFGPLKEFLQQFY
ncbi:MAG: hypothetical protein QM731_06010 [Chitinophagaceae bacterium]